MQVLIAAVISYIGTNLDDLLVLTFLYSQIRRKSDPFRILIGKYIGLGTILLLSWLGAYGIGSVSSRLISLLGFIPVFLGIRSFFTKNEENETVGQESGNLLWNTAVITVAGGADNFGVYIPLFAGYSLFDMQITILVFALMTPVWCFLGRIAAGLPLMRKLIEKHGRVIVPTAYIALGIYILTKPYR